MDGIKANFDLTEDQKQIADQVDRFGREELAPLQERMDREDWWPDDMFKKMGELGILGATVPASHGGAGVDLFTECLIGQVLGRWSPAVAMGWLAHDNLCVNNILRNGNGAQKEKYLPGLCSGELIGALGLTEPGAGSDALGSMRTTARRDGDHYVLNGTKIFITNGPIADIILVYAKTELARGPHGISAFILETKTPGFKVAQKLDKMGFRGSPTGELVFEDCRVPAENLVGAENSGVSVVMSGLDLERVAICFLCVGMAERALELALDYSTLREQFSQPIARFQMIQSKLAEMYVDLEVARAMSYRAAAACNDLETGGGGRGPIHKLTAAACLYAGEAFNRIVTEATHIHGGSGYMQDTEINRLYRTNKLLEIGAGTSEVRKIIIAGEMLKS